MGDVDIADQIRGVYRFDKWARKYKWWHSIFWWAFQVMMVNAYVSYKHHMEGHGLKPMSHYEFQKDISRAFISGKVVSTKTRQRPDDEFSMASSLTSSVTKSTRERFSDTSLHPVSGRLRARLDYSSCKHWPVPTKKKESHCQLHWWASSGAKTCRVHKNTVLCEECNVHLCSGYCYRVFHEVWDLVAEKEGILQRLLDDAEDDNDSSKAQKITKV